MVCVAAFIILCLISVFVLILSIFKRDLGAKYWKVFKKAWGCVWKKVRLQKCETDFKDDVKNSILKHFVIKRPKWVKPISVAIEVSAVLIVVISIWSLVEATKAGMGLVVLGTCNVSAPASCSLGAEACTLEEAAAPKNLAEGVKRWFADWGEIFAGIPDRIKTWKVEDYLIPNTPVITEAYRKAPLALDVMDPLCAVCMQSYRNQINKKFFTKYNTFVLPYAIMVDEKKPKYQNSDLIVRYIHATWMYDNGRQMSGAPNPGLNILKKIFTEYDSEHINYQSVFANQLNTEEAEKLLKEWFREFKYKAEEVEQIAKLAHSEEVTARLRQVDEIVRNKIHARGIPTMIYDGKKHFGLYK